MKKITLKALLFLAFMCSPFAQAQCLEAAEGLYPAATSNATTCDGIGVTTITTLAYASEYSNVNVTAGETYTFRSSVATDYITISADDGVSAAASGVTPVTWVADVTGVVRFYTHTDDLCGASQDFRTRSYVCGVPPCTQPVVTFAKTYDCGSSTFEITADITDIGTASTLTITDDQSSPSQSVSSANMVTFGPYPFGTSVVLTVTNDQTPICNVVSDALVVYACPPTNDLCEDAIVLNCGDTLTNQITEGATGGTNSSCLGTIGDEIWYSYVGDGQITTVTVTASVQFPQIEVYPSTDGTCAGFTVGDCLIAAGTGETEASVSFVSTIGTTYYMHVGNYVNGDPAIVFDLSITCSEPATPPANDECDGAIALSVNSDLGCGSVTSATLAGATASTVTDTTCFGTADDDVWFSFVASETTHSISLNNVAGSTTDLYHSLWTGDCSGLTLVDGTCSDSNVSTPLGLTPGQTYYLRVYSYTSTPLQDSTFDVCIGTLPPPPANDDCTGAIEVTVGSEFATSPIVGDNTSSTSTTGLPTFMCQTNRSNDVWYSVVVPASGNLTIETDATTGTLMTDSVVSVYSGTCGSLTEIGCNDDDGNANFSKVVLTGLTAGETLYIGVWKYGTSSDGAFQLSAYDPSLANDIFETSSFKVHPNPVQNVLNLSFDKVISHVAVYNLLGQEVIAKNNNANLSQIDMSGLMSGTYFVKVTAENQTKTIKIVKE